MEVTEQALYMGIERLQAGKRLGDLGLRFSKRRGRGYSVVRAFVVMASARSCMRNRRCRLRGA
jgi:methionine aminopeptidase